jgi:hypothetical protein
MTDHPLLTFALILAGGFATGLLLQLIAVLVGVQNNSRRGYMIAALVGVGGAIAGIPVSALLDYARGGSGELARALVLSASNTLAIVCVCYWIMFRNLNRIGRLVLIGSASLALLVFIVAASMVRN